MTGAKGRAMHIELTDQERLQVQQGQPVDVTDPRTNEAYILIARQHFDQLRSLLTKPPATPEPHEPGIPEGIKISQEAYRRDLPQLLKQKKLYRQWVAYHRNERIGIAPSKRTLLVECFERRKLADDEFFVGWVHEYGFLEDEEVEPRPQHYEGADEDS
jgi:hypothetical protein